MYICKLFPKISLSTNFSGLVNTSYSLKVNYWIFTTQFVVFIIFTPTETQTHHPSITSLEVKPLSHECYAKVELFSSKVAKKMARKWSPPCEEAWNNYPRTFVHIFGFWRGRGLLRKNFIFCKKSLGWCNLEQSHELTSFFEFMRLYFYFYFMPIRLNIWNLFLIRVKSVSFL